MKRQGFSLLELVLALGLVGIILVGVVTLTTDTLTTTTAIRSEAARLDELRDATAYVGDNIRRAAYIYPDNSVTVNSAKCLLPHCVAMIVPDTRDSAGVRQNTIQRYVFLAFWFKPRAGFSSAYKETDTWADSNTRVLLEYRLELCTVSAASCPTPMAMPAPPSNVTASEYLIADRITLQGSVGTYTPFVVDVSAVTIRVRSAQQVKGSTVFTPRQDAYRQVVYSRN